MSWKIEHHYASGWADAVWTEDGVPVRFTTQSLAEAAIREFVTDAQIEGLDYRAEDYRAVPENESP